MERFYGAVEREDVIMPLLGAHMSVGGGLHLAFKRLVEAGGESLQIFTRNQRQWKASPISSQEAFLFSRAWEEAGRPPVASHGSYLVNLASPKKELVEKSVAALADELVRCSALRIPYLVIHPGAHVGQGVKKGLARVAVNLDLAMERAGQENRVMVLLETTAGQGTTLGSTFEELAEIISLSRNPERLGVCYDTCHSFVAGYDIGTPESYGQTWETFDRILGLDRVRFFHLNDSLGGLGGRKDRHSHIGAGQIGLAGFSLLMNDPRFAEHPMTLETPKGEDLAEDIENLRVLRSLIGMGGG